jgi:hypothetical protein
MARRKQANESRKCLSIMREIGPDLSNQVYNYNSGDALVTQCNDGTYCCGQGNNTCCDQGKGVRIAAIDGTPVSSSIGTSSTLSATSSATKSSTSPTQLGSNPPNGKGSNTGAIAGGVVGGVVGGIIIAAAAWYFWRRRSRGAAPAEIGHGEAAVGSAKVCSRIERRKVGPNSNRCMTAREIIKSMKLGIKILSI